MNLFAMLSSNAPLALMALVSFSVSADQTQSLKDALSFNNSSALEITKQASKSAVEIGAKRRELLSSGGVHIPKTWELIAVLPKQMAQGKNGYMLFFQDKVAMSVVAFGITDDGMISDANTLHIPAK